jgi:hypothetical protein
MTNPRPSKEGDSTEMKKGFFKKIINKVAAKKTTSINPNNSFSGAASKVNNAREPKKVSSIGASKIPQSARN